MTDETSPVQENKIKAHFARNKNRYILAGAVVGTAVVTAVVTKYATQQVAAGGSEMLVEAKNQALLQWKPTAEITVKLKRRGHPGFLVKVNETGETYASIRRMCEVVGISRADFYNYVNGKIDNVQGLTFEVLGEAL